MLVDRVDSVTSSPSAMKKALFEKKKLLNAESA